MSPVGYFIDSNLLVLRIVGDVGRDLIQKHKRSKRFTAEDYDKLLTLLNATEQVLVTPNTLTEASNLLAQHKEPERSKFLDRLRHIIRNSREIVVASAKASANISFHRLGLTDSVLLETVSEDTPLVTVDLDLYLIASTQSPNAAFNFNYLQST